MASSARLAALTSHLAPKNLLSTKNEKKQLLEARATAGAAGPSPADLGSALAEAERSYADGFIRGILTEIKTIVMVGASTTWNRPSNFAMKYLQAKGYRVIPVNPAAKGQDLLGETVLGSLSELPFKEMEQGVMVDLFRASEQAGVVTDEALKLKQEGKLDFSVLWMQLGVVNEAAQNRAEAAGVKVVMDRCPKIEFSRLFGELGWHGFDSGVISSKRRTPGRASAPPDEELPKFTGFETRAIHAGAAPDPSTGARSTPIFQTTAYVFDDVEHAAALFNLATFGNIYSRLSNPTTAVLEERICALEGARGGTCCASGHAAQMLTLFCLMQPGCSLVASTRLYGGSITQFSKTIKKFSWDCEFVDVDDLDAVRKACSKPSVRMLWVESLANPGGVVSDLRGLSAIANEAGIPLVVDNTMATPYLCRPIEHGADIVVHSTTKFMSGQGNSMGGVLLDSGKFDWLKYPEKFPSLAQAEPAYHGLVFAETFGDLALTMFSHAVGLRDLGPTMAPMNAWITLNGVETLGLRMDRHCSNAQRVAEFLNQHPFVKWVSYAGLPSDKYNTLAKQYMQNGNYGSVFTFGVKGGYSAGVRVVENLNLASHLANIGDSRTLILHPASTTHRQLTPEQREAAGAGDDVLRISVGLETVGDIIADLEYGLRQAQKGDAMEANPTLAKGVATSAPPS